MTPTEQIAADVRAGWISVRLAHGLALNRCADVSEAMVVALRSRGVDADRHLYDTTMFTTSGRIVECSTLSPGGELAGHVAVETDDVLIDPTFDQFGPSPHPGKSIALPDLVIPWGQVILPADDLAKILRRTFGANLRHRWDFAVDLPDLPGHPIAFYRDRGVYPLAGGWVARAILDAMPARVAR
jgi:hypothetical protein